MSKRTAEAEQEGEKAPRVALLYCRVSSERQKTEGHGLESQELRCKQYAEQKGYEVEAVFRDSFTGGGDFMRRPGMTALLDHADKNGHKTYVVVFDDLSRFARDIAAHLKLRQEFDRRGIKIECPNFTFEDSPEGELVENIMAAQNQYHRKSNRRQVIQKQKARLEAGYWPFYHPVGYKQTKDPMHGKLLTQDDKAPIVREAFEGYASGRFRTQSDLRVFLEQMKICGDRPVYLAYVQRLLDREIYAGWIEYPDWGVKRRQGHHQSIVSPDVFDKVQERMSGRTFKRSTEREDFPLRGLVMCSKCEHALTAGWSKGRTKMYAYYRCQRIRCKERDVKKETIEGELEKLLIKLQPKPEVLALTEAILIDAWKKRLERIDEVLDLNRKERVALELEKKLLIDKITVAESQSVVHALEERVAAVDQKIEMGGSSAKLSLSAEDYGTAVRLVFDLLKCPADVWQNGGFQGKRLITKLIFVENPVYDRELAYGTADLSAVIKLFGLIQADSLHDVEVRGIGPRSESGYESESTTHSER